MQKKCERKGIVLVTIVSCLLFLSMIVIVSLSPVSEIGHNVNQFNSPGMWASIAFILISYLIPLMFYLFGVEQMKYMMALFCSLGLLITIATALFIVAASQFSGTLSDHPTLIIGLFCCGLLFLANLLWFFVAFTPSARRARLELQ